MHAHERNELAEKLLEQLGTRPDLKGAVMTGINNYFADRIALIWTAGDIVGEAESIDLALDDDDTETVLDYLLESHDASLGLNWERIQDAIRYLRANGRITPGPLSEGDADGGDADD